MCQLQTLDCAQPRLELCIAISVTQVAHLIDVLTMPFNQDNKFQKRAVPELCIQARFKGLQVSDSTLDPQFLRLGKRISSCIAHLKSMTIAVYWWF
jgi:hypothetical protein